MPCFLLRSSSDRTKCRTGPARVLRARGERGASMVEFALILPVFLMIIFGGITAAISYEHKEDIVHAVRDGVRYGATLPYTQCDSSGCPSGRTWAQQVQYVTILRSGGTLSTSDNVCVALVTGSASTPAVYGTASNFSTTGSACFTDTTGDTNTRVQVSVSHSGDTINLVFHTINVTVSSSATERHE
jgi:Flp pilus assembly protein TadG